ALPVSPFPGVPELGSFTPAIGLPNAVDDCRTPQLRLEMVTAATRKSEDQRIDCMSDSGTTNLAEQGAVSVPLPSNCLSTHGRRVRQIPKGQCRAGVWTRTDDRPEQAGRTKGRKQGE